MQGHWPSLVVYVEAPPALVAERLDRRQLDRFEQAGDDFHRRVLDGFRAMAAADPDRWIVVSTDRTTHEVAAEVLAAVTARLPELATHVQASR